MNTEQNSAITLRVSVTVGCNYPCKHLGKTTHTCKNQPQQRYKINDFKLNLVSPVKSYCRSVLYLGRSNYFFIN